MIHARERLGWHEKPQTETTQVFSEDAWAALADGSSEISGEPTFALQVSPSRDWSAILAGGFTGDGRVHLETTSSKAKGGPRVYNRRASTDWVVPWFRSRLVGRKAKYERMTVVLLGGSQAMSLKPALDKIPGLTVEVLPDAQLAAACGHMLDQVSTGAVVHVGDPELAASMVAVGKRMVGERTFVWSPRSSAGDITAAMAATVLAWWLELGGNYDVEDSVG